ncbi:hypothetical protein SERLA73DRAFT_188189, partial [Serpula lacrymans var. lacrymans S7.3]
MNFASYLTDLPEDLPPVLVDGLTLWEERTSVSRGLLLQNPGVCSQSEINYPHFDISDNDYPDEELAFQTYIDVTQSDNTQSFSEIPQLRLIPPIFSPTSSASPFLPELSPDSSPLSVASSSVPITPEFGVCMTDIELSPSRASDHSRFYHQEDDYSYLSDDDHIPLLEDVISKQIAEGEKPFNAYTPLPESPILRHSESVLSPSSSSTHPASSKSTCDTVFPSQIAPLSLYVDEVSPSPTSVPVTESRNNRELISSPASTGVPRHSSAASSSSIQHSKRPLSHASKSSSP